MPIDLIATAKEEQVTLREDAGELDKLPVFEERYYLPLVEAERDRTGTPKYLPGPMYWYPPYSTVPQSAPGYALPVIHPYVIETQRNVLERTVALREGADVVAADDEKVGDVEQVLTGSEADQVTRFVVSQGLLFEEKKLVPFNWVDRVTEEAIFLAVGSDFLESLPDYQG